MVQSTIFTEEDPKTSAAYRRVGLLNGLTIGLGLALGIWGGPLLFLTALPLPLRYTGLILQILVTILICGLTGWLTARLAKSGITIIAWLFCSLLLANTLVYLPERLRTLAVWLADSRFWGLPIYPGVQVRAATPYLVSFFMILILMVLALVQDYRVEAIQRAAGPGGRLGVAVWLRLFLVVPVLILIGYITGIMSGTNYSWWASRMTNQAIQGTLSYEGDLFELSRQEGLNYNALRGVRSLLTPVYSLNIAETSDSGDTSTVTAYFNNGAWINCQFIGDNLANCFDVAGSYTSGLAGIIRGEPIPDPQDCPRCFPRVDEMWINWLQERHGRLGDEPRLSRLAQWGSFVLMRAESEAGDFVIECLFQGISPVRLESCAEVN